MKIMGFDVLCEYVVKAHDRAQFSGLLLRYAHFAPELSKSLPSFSKIAIIDQIGANLLNNVGF